MYTFIETQRLRIRPIELHDDAFILELVNSEGWLKFIGQRNILSKKNAQKYIQKILDNESFYYHVFELKATQKALGIVTFLERENENFPDIGFALLPQFEKNGFTFEATKAYLEEINKSNKYNNIIAITLPENEKSIRLLKKLGLKYKGDFKKNKETLSYFSLRES